MSNECYEGYAVYFRDINDELHVWLQKLIASLSYSPWWSKVEILDLDTESGWERARVYEGVDDFPEEIKYLIYLITTPAYRVIETDNPDPEERVHVIRAQDCPNYQSEGILPKPKVYLFGKLTERTGTDQLKYLLAMSAANDPQGAS